MPELTALDLAVSLSVVAGAVSFLIYRLLKPAPPACHSVAGPVTSAKAPDVLLGAALSRGLKRAQARRADRAR